MPGFEGHVGRVQDESSCGAVVLKAEGDLGVQRRRVAHGQLLHVLRVLALLVAVPGLTTQQRAELKRLTAQDVLLVYDLSTVASLTITVTL